MPELWVAVTAGIFVFSLVILLFGRKASEQDMLNRRLDLLIMEANRPYAIREEELEKSFAKRVLVPLIHKLTVLISAVIPIRTGKHSGAEKQKKMLMQAGWIITYEEYMTIQLILMAGAGILGLILALMTGKGAAECCLYSVIGIFAVYTVLRYVCSAAGNARKKAMEKQLPDMLDLLSVSVAAGLGFERAMLHVTETMDGPLIDEFAVAYREMSMGRSRKEALTLLSERCGVEDLSSVTGAIIQAGQLGIPVRNVLHSQSAAIRRTRRSKVQEKAAKVSTKIMLPMVAFIFPVLLIVLMGPSIITIIGMF